MAISGTTGWSWATSYLPYIEEDTLHSQIKFKYPAQMHVPKPNFVAGGTKDSRVALPVGSKGLRIDRLLQRNH